MRSVFLGVHIGRAYESPEKSSALGKTISLIRHQTIEKPEQFEVRQILRCKCFQYTHVHLIRRQENK